MRMRYTSVAMEDEDFSPEEIKQIVEKARREWLWGEISTAVPYFAGMLLLVIVLAWLSKF